MAAVSSANACRVARKPAKTILGWNYHVRESHEWAKQCFSWWDACGRPCAGESFDNMVHSRKAFKNKLRWCQNNEDTIRMNILATHQADRNFGKFWKDTKKLNPKTSVPVSIEGVHNTKEIAELFSHHFSVEPLTAGAARGDTSVSYGSPSEKADRIHFTPEKLANIVRSMKRGQACLDGPFCDHTEEEKMTFLRTLLDLGVKNIEMEATAFAAYTREAGVRAADVCVTLLDRLQGDQVTSNKDKMLEWQARPIALVGKFIADYCKRRGGQ